VEPSAAITMIRLWFGAMIRRNAIRWPSGDQMGSASIPGPDWVSGTGPDVPSTGSAYRAPPSPSGASVPQ
jgi:hypothetical protein